MSPRVRGHAAHPAASRLSQELQAGAERSVPVYASNRQTTIHKSAWRPPEQFASYFCYRCWRLDVERERDVVPSVFWGIVDLTCFARRWRRCEEQTELALRTAGHCFHPSLPFSGEAFSAPKLSATADARFHCYS